MAGKTNTVSVEIQAQIEGYKKALQDATNATAGFANAVKSHIGTLSIPFEAFGKTLLAVGAIAAGGSMFKGLVDQTLEAASETKKLAMTFGMSLQSASEMRVELKTLGITTEDYTGAAMKLDRQVRTNAETLQRHGLVIKDSNGNFLEQSTLMQNSIKWLLEFKAGTDRNIASQVLFGRNVGEVNSLLKLNAEAAARAKKDTAELGLGQTDADLERAHKYKIAINELALSMEAITRNDNVIEVLTNFATWFREQTPMIIAKMKEITAAIINGTIDIVKSILVLGDGFEGIKSKAMTAYTVISAVFAAQTLSFNGLKDAARAARDAWAELGSSTSHESSLQSSIAMLESLRTALFAPTPEGESILPSAGKRSAAGLEKGADAKGDQIEKIRQERIRLQNDYELTAEDVKNRHLLELGQMTEAQFLKSHMDYLQRKAAVDDLALTKERDAFPLGSVEWEKAENHRVKATVDANLAISEANHRLVQEQQKMFLDLARSINSSFESSLSGLIQTIGDKTKSIADVFKSFTASLSKVFADFAAKQSLALLLGGLPGGSGVGGSAGGLGGIIGKLFSGFKAGGGYVPSGRWAIAGDAGPEPIFGGSTGATVLPNRSMGGGAQVNHFNISVDGATGNTEVMRMVMAGMQEAVRKSVSMAPGVMASYQKRMA